jgi:RHS repeat-associated protein
VVATNTFGINGLVSRNDSSGTNFYAFDPQGSTAERVDSSGALVSSDCYNAWGTASTTASAAVVFGYIAQWGYYTDAETGLVLCTHRYYDPARGRWLNRDPIGYVGGIDVYAYCQDEPVGGVDPSGYWWCKKQWKAFEDDLLDGLKWALYGCLLTVGAAAQACISTGLPTCVEAFMVGGTPAMGACITALLLQCSVGALEGCMALAMPLVLAHAFTVANDTKCTCKNDPNLR